MASRHFDEFAADHVIEVCRTAPAINCHDDDVASHTRVQVRNQEAGSLVRRQTKEIVSHRTIASVHKEHMQIGRGQRVDIRQIDPSILQVRICRAGRIDWEDQYRTRTLVVTKVVLRWKDLSWANCRIRTSNAWSARIIRAVCCLAEIDAGHCIIQVVAIRVVIHLEGRTEPRSFSDVLSNTNLECHRQCFSGTDFAVPLCLRCRQGAVSCRSGA